MRKPPVPRWSSYLCLLRLVQEVLSQTLPVLDVIALANCLRFTECFDEVVSHGVPVADDGLAALAEIMSNPRINALSLVCRSVTPLEAARDCE